MANRRSLVTGLKSEDAVERELEQKFVFQGKPTSDRPTPAAEAPTAPDAREGKGRPAKGIARAPFATRMRADFATALKRASLERQLEGVEPNTLQDILEEAVEPWLRTNGYLQ